MGPLPTTAPDSLPPNTDTAPASPVRVANAAGRALFIVPTDFGGLWLLETQTARYRLCRLGRINEFGGIAYQLCPRQRPRLLVLTNTEGSMGAGRCASGEAHTWLQVYDLAQDKLLLNALLGRYQTTLSCDDAEGQEVGVARYCRVAPDGQTIVLGYYADDLGEGAPRRDSAAALPPSIFGAEGPAATSYPPGTYHWQAGRYQRAR